MVEVLEQPADRLIDRKLPTLAWFALRSEVSVPSAGAAAAMLNLNEPHAALDESSRRQQLLAEFAALGLVETVELLGLRPSPSRSR